jgi:putative endonuclease
MYFVYFIKSVNYPNKLYIGYTKDIKIRLEEHNQGNSLHTSKYKPWELVNCVGFKSKQKALEFERYVKSGSGRAFAKRHLL